MNRFEDQVCVITGAASGIGLATARVLAAEGAFVAINDSRHDAAEAAAASIRDSGGRALAIAGDVSDPAQVQRNIDSVMAVHQRIDVLVNNAGLVDFGPAQSLAFEHWRRSIAVNLDGAFLWAQAVAVRSMIPRRTGKIVNVASSAGLAAVPSRVGYVTAKHALLGLTKSLAVEWGRHGISVNAICPGLTETQLVRDASAANPALFEGRARRVPIGRNAQPEEQARAITFLLSSDASYVNGLVMPVDGGLHALYAGYTLDVDAPHA